MPAELLELVGAAPVATRSDSAEAVMQLRDEDAIALDIDSAISRLPAGIDQNRVPWVFAGLHFEPGQWVGALSKGPPLWLKPCRLSRGKPGNNGRAAAWDPVLIGVALVEKHGVAPRDVTERFQTTDELVPWRAAWAEAKVRWDNLED